MAEKRINYNQVFVSGEVLDILNIARMNQGTGQEAIRFTLKVETAPNESVNVDYFTSMFKSDGSPNQMFLGIETIANEIKTRAEDGKGDIVRCVCSLDNNLYYKDGEKKERFQISGTFCNREKYDDKGNPIDDKGEVVKSIKASQGWRVYTLIENIEEKEDDLGKYLEIKGLINKYGKQGCNMTFRIHNEDMIEGFKSLYKIGDVGLLEGTVKSMVVSKSAGFGSRIKKSAFTFLEIEGGDEPLKDGDKIFSDKNYPFTDKNIEAMREKIKEKDKKEKQRDIDKNGKTIEIRDDDVPF
ncbi:hypothetical protein QGE_2998 [Clostridioides difficile CD200]|uniref:hypothetical protein n=1 Tax=Clostridioides difficile TaxID=1496 RepID=UPI00038C73FD|nr:hypothetical protein [Clostridioides difficile]EQF59383.1 hypothetical protein QGE_2998 [Clostridioides difficile CD200]